MNPSLRFSRLLAIVYAILIVIMETIRRKDQLLDPAAFMLWFDDYMLGGFLLWAAWRAAKDSQETGARYLSAAWGLAVGALFMSFRGQLSRLDVPDATNLISSTTVAILKGIFLLVAFVGMVVSMWQPKHSR